MLRKRYYILFVARDEDGRIRKIPCRFSMYMDLWPPRWWEPLLSWGWPAPTPASTQDRKLQSAPPGQRELSKNYKQMAQIAHDRNVQVASLGALANEVTALYGLRQNRLAKSAPAATAAAQPTPATWP